VEASEGEPGTTGDGRVQRGARNRTLIIDALIQLIREGVSARPQKW